MEKNPSYGNLLIVGDVILHTDILTECFCCDLDACHGKCCIEGDAGAPVMMDEKAEMEEALDMVWADLSAQAQAEIDKNGVCYIDPEGELVTTIVNGKDCVFTCYQDGCCLCALEKACRQGKTKWPKPISCSLYPIREKKLGDMTGLNYHRWDVCQDAVRKGRELGMPMYKFLREPLVRRFGTDWYRELEETASAYLSTLNSLQENSINH